MRATEYKPIKDKEIEALDSKNTKAVSTELINKVPKDVWNEIFGYVKCKAILKFICKKWYIHAHHMPKDKIIMWEASTIFLQRKLESLPPCYEFGLLSSTPDAITCLTEGTKKFLHVRKYSGSIIPLTKLASKFPNLEKLEFDTDLTDEKIIEVKTAFPNIKHLTCKKYTLSEEGEKELTFLPHLTFIKTDETSYDDDKNSKLARKSMRISSTLEDRFIFIDISRTLQANAEFLKQFSHQKLTSFPQIRTINLNLNLTETDIPNIKATSWEKFNSLEKLVINIPTTIEGEIYLFEIFLSALRGVPKTIREKLSRVKLYHSSETPISIDNTALIQLTTLYPNLRKLHLTSSKFAVRTISAETLKAFEAKKTTITTKLSPNGLNRIDYDAKKIILDDSIPIKDICTKFPLLETIKIPKSTSITLEDLQKLVMVDSLLNINFETKPTDIDLTKIKKMGMAPSIYFDDEETSE